MMHQNRLVLHSTIGSDERGLAFVSIMLITLMTGMLGMTALTMSGLENSMAGAVRMVEEGTFAAEACIGTAVRVINVGMDDNTFSSLDGLMLLSPQGPVPAVNKTILGQEISGTLSMRNNADVAVGTGSAPNLTMRVHHFDVNGDIDYLYIKNKAGGDAQSVKLISYRVDCTATSTLTGTTSRVIAVFECQREDDTCMRRPAT